MVTRLNHFRLFHIITALSLLLFIAPKNRSSFFSRFRGMRIQSCHILLHFFWHIIYNDCFTRIHPLLRNNLILLFCHFILICVLIISFFLFIFFILLLILSTTISTHKFKI